MLQLTIGGLDKKTADAIIVLAKKAGANSKKKKSKINDETHLEEFDTLITRMKKKYYTSFKN